MFALLKSGFFLRFAGGFAFGAATLFGLQPGSVASNLASLIGTVAHVA